MEDWTRTHFASSCNVWAGSREVKDTLRHRGMISTPCLKLVMNRVGGAPIVCSPWYSMDTHPDSQA